MGLISTDEVFNAVRTPSVEQHKRVPRIENDTVGTLKQAHVVMAVIVRKIPRASVNKLFTRRDARRTR